MGDLEKRVRVARHLERCSECRQFVGFTQRLSNAAASLPASAPSEDLLARALADREGGARSIIPTTAPAPVTSPRRTLRPVVLVAASIIIAVATISQLRGRDFRGANELLLAGLAPKSALAGQGGTAAGPLAHRLRALTLTFQRHMIDSASGRSVSWGTLDVSIAAGAHDNSWRVGAVWRDIERVPDMDNARVWAETVTVADESLAPSRRVVHVTPYRRWDGILIEQSFRNDSVVGQMSLDNDPTRRPIARDLRSARDRMVASDALSPFYLMGVPLVIGTEINASILGWSVVSNDVLVPIQMKVVAAERVTTPAGTFDCWKLAIHVANQTHYHWVRKSDHLGILTRRRLPDGNVREVILTREATKQ